MKMYDIKFEYVHFFRENVENNSSYVASYITCKPRSILDRRCFSLLLEKNIIFVSQ